MAGCLQRTVRGLGIACVTLGLAACGGGSSSPPQKAPVIERFTASPSWLTTGGTATLNWSVTGAEGLNLSEVGVVTGTSARVTPAADTTYGRWL